MLLLGYSYLNMNTRKPPTETGERHRRESHLCRVASNTVWSHMACDFP